MTFHLIGLPVARARAGRRLLMALCLGTCLTFIAPAFSVAAEPLTLSGALQRAWENTAAQRGAAARLEAANAAARQAGVKPNPTIGLDVENIGGTEPYGLVDRSETTLYYQQTIERGGKRQARTEVAQREVDVVRARQTIVQLELFQAVETRWVEALVADAEVDLAEKRLAIALKSRDEVMRRVNAARDPLFAGTQVDAEVAQARLDLDQAKARSLSARQTLATYWGGPVDFELDGSTLTIPTLAALPTAPESTPDLLLLQAERSQANARVRLEQTRSTQDFNVRGGVRYFNADGAAAFILGGSMPLGRNDTNRGNIERAQAEQLAAESDIEARRLQILRERSRLLSSLNIHIQEVARIDSEVLPPAIKTLDLVRDGFARGGFRHTDVIEAAEAIAKIEARRLAAIKAANLDIVALNRLDGRYAGLVAPMDNQP